MNTNAVQTFSHLMHFRRWHKDGNQKEVPAGNWFILNSRAYTQLCHMRLCSTRFVSTLCSHSREIEQLLWHWKRYRPTFSSFTEDNDQKSKWNWAYHFLNKLSIFIRHLEIVKNEGPKRSFTKYLTHWVIINTLEDSFVAIHMFQPQLKGYICMNGHVL